MKPTNPGESPADVANGFRIGFELSNIGASSFSGAQQTLREVMPKLQPAVSWSGFLPEGAAHSRTPFSSRIASSRNL